jgi:hypothetical protein
MKQILLIIGIASSNFLFGQDVCMVSADYLTGENMIVMWEWPASTAGIESVIIYRKSEGETVFTRVGSTNVGEISAFTDDNVNTTIWNAYRITYKYDTGNESNPSLWHKPVLLDYGYDISGTGAPGYITWSEYQIEGIPSNTFVQGYSCYSDQTGFGSFNLMNVWTVGGSIMEWYDQEYALNPNTKYMIEVDLPNCNVQKGNINTSRSNIKKQIQNIEVGIESLNAETLGISPNPVEDKLKIGNIDQLTSVNIVDCSGKTVYSSQSNQLSHEIDLSHLTEGVYFIEAFDAEGTRYANKLVKQ